MANIVDTLRVLWIVGAGICGVLLVGLLLLCAYGMEEDDRE